MKSRKIVYAAVAAALATAVIVLCAYLPVKFVPLVFASAAYYVALDRCGYFGLLGVAASLIIAFFGGGGSQTTFVLTVILFAPYSVFAYAMRKIQYTTTKNWIIRCVSVVVLFVLSAVLAIVLLDFITGVSLEVVVDKVGSWAIAAVFALAAVPTDFFFAFAMGKITKALGKG